MTGHDSAEQNSVIVPYNMLIWLKKSTAEKKNKDWIFKLNSLFINSVKVNSIMFCLKLIERSWKNK